MPRVGKTRADAAVTNDGSAGGSMMRLFRVVVPRGRGGEYALRAVGIVVAIALAIVTAIWESTLTSWYVMSGGHQIRLPIAPLAAIVCNLALIWFVRRVVGHAAWAVLPGIAWFVVIFLAATLTSEGDLIILGNWVGTLTLLLGTLSWAVGAYIVVIRSRRGVPRPASATPPSVKRPGAGPSGGKPSSAKPSSAKPSSAKGATPPSARSGRPGPGSNSTPRGRR